MSFEIRSARRTFSFVSAADVNVVAGVLTATATAITPQTLTTGDLNGSVVLAGGVLKPARMVTITRSAAVGAYTTDPIVLTGQRGAPITVSLVQTSADGGDTITTGILIDSIKTIALPAMGSTGGSLQVGVQDVGAHHGEYLTGVRLAAAGLLPVAYDHEGLETDTIDAGTEYQPIAAKRVATSTITSGFTIYLP